MLIIDGHNLIPKIPGLSLREVDDEEHLVALLQIYARVTRKQVTVFFDGALPGQPEQRTYGMIHAHFIQSGWTADEAIRQHVKEMGKGARNVTVVSSDHQVQTNARALHAQVISSEAFASELLNLSVKMGSEFSQNQRKRTDTPPKPVPPAESKPSGSKKPAGNASVDEWLDVFGIDPDKAEQPIELRQKPAAKKKQNPPAAKPPVKPSDSARPAAAAAPLHRPGETWPPAQPVHKPGAYKSPAPASMAEKPAAGKPPAPSGKKKNAANQPPAKKKRRTPHGFPPKNP